MIFCVMPATAADVKHCAALEGQYFSEPWSELSFLNAVEDEDSLFYVAKTDNKVIGYFVAGIICDEINLYTIAVDMEYRKQGIGNRLIEMLLQCAGSLRVIAVYLEVRTSNISAIRLYEKYGFKQIGLRKAFYKKPTEDAFLFALYLNEENV